MSSDEWHGTVRETPTGRLTYSRHVHRLEPDGGDARALCGARLAGQVEHERDMRPGTPRCRTCETLARRAEAAEAPEADGPAERAQGQGRWWP